MIEKIEPDQRRDLVVAAATGAQFAAELRAGDLDKSALKRKMNVFVRIERTERATIDARLQLGKGSKHPRKFSVVEVTALGEGLGVRLRPGDVIGVELPVEVSRPAERRKLRRRTVSETRAPEGTLVTLSRLHLGNLSTSTGSVTDKLGDRQTR
jgi:hypothetical protein